MDKNKTHLQVYSIKMCSKSEDKELWSKTKEFPVPWV